MAKNTKVWSVAIAYKASSDDVRARAYSLIADSYELAVGIGVGWFLDDNVYENSISAVHASPQDEDDLQSMIDGRKKKVKKKR